MQEEERQRKAAMQMKLEKLRQDKDMWMQQQRMQAMARMQGYIVLENLFKRIFCPFVLQ